MSRDRSWNLSNTPWCSLTVVLSVLPDATPRVPMPRTSSHQEHLWEGSRPAWYAVGFVCTILLVLSSGAPTPPSPGSASPPPPQNTLDNTPDPPPSELSEPDLHHLYALTAETTSSAVTHIAREHALSLGEPCSPSRLERARTLYLRGNPSAALIVLGALQERPECERHTFLTARLRRELSGPAEALQALDLLPSDHPLADYFALETGHAHIALGAFEEAIAAYQEVLAFSDSPVFHEAAVARAKALFELNDFERAEPALSDILDTYPEYPRVEVLLLHRGQARLALGEREGAARDFDAVVFGWPHKEAAKPAAAALEMLARDGVDIPSHSYEDRYQRARDLRRNRHWGLAEQAYTELLEDVRTYRGLSKEENRLRLQLALNAYEESDYATAIPRLNALLEITEKHPDVRGVSRSYVLGRLVNAHAYAGDFENARRYVQLRDRVVSRSTRERRMADFLETQGRFAEALELYDDFLKDRDKRSWEYAFLVFNAGEHERAARLLADLEDRASSRDRDRYTYWRARALAAHGDTSDARSLYQSLVDDQPMTYYGFQAANRLLELDAASLRAEDPSPDTRAEHRGQAHEGTLTPEEDETPHTVTSLAGLTEEQVRGPDAEGSTETPLAKSPEAVKRPARIHWWGHPFAEHPQFGRRAEQRDQNVERAPGERKPDYLHHASLVGAIREAAQRHGELFPRLVRAAFLHDVGLETEARWEMRDVALEYRGLRRRSGAGGRKPNPGKPWSLSYKRYRHLRDKRKEKVGWWGADMSSSRFPIPDSAQGKRALAERQRQIIEARDVLDVDLWRAFKEAGDYYLVRGRAKPYSLRKYDPLEHKEMLPRWSEALPRAFPRLVQTRCEIENLNPYLLWSIMRVESEFNPDTVSWADARGLLQVIPKTGIKVAWSMGVDEYGPHDLLDERLSIQFGTWYLGQTVAKFQGQELLAAAGYNGGPHNVARWLTMRGHAMDLDAFIETIPYDESRNYAKKTLRYIGIYLRIYEGRDRVYVGNQLETRFLAHPNY